MADAILSLKEVNTYIAQHHILQGVTLDVTAGRPTVFLGRNGAGKSSTLRAIIGLNPVTSGEIYLDGLPIQDRKPYEIARLGVGFVAEDRAVFYNLSVEENMRLSMFEENEQTRNRLETVLGLFPDLKRLWRTKAGLLSGGQKQMLAIARAFVNDHRILLIDEPSIGLAPKLVTKLFSTLKQIKEDTGKTLFLAEQNVKILRIADRVIGLEGGEVKFVEKSSGLDEKSLQELYMGQ